MTPWRADLGEGIVGYRLFTSSLLILTVAAASGPSLGMTIHVPGDHPTIQEGLDAASNGDTVLVAPDTYSGPGNVNLSFGGKDIVLVSEGGPDVTTIFIGTQNRAVLFTKGETQAAFVGGFTMMSGELVVGSGGAILCSASSPTIGDCIFFQNFVADNGGAIFCTDGASPFIDDCEFTQNTANFEGSGRGGAIFISEGSVAVVEGCQFYGNYGGDAGGAIGMGSGGSLTVRDCTFWNNGAGSNERYGVGGAIYGGALIQDCVFIGNGAGSWDRGGAGGALYGSGIAERCLFEGNFAQDNGGATSGSWTIRNSTISANYTEDSDGKGGGVYVTGFSESTLENTIVWGNCAANGAEAYADFEDVSAGTLIFSCCATDSTQVQGPGTIEYQGEQVFSDPIFCDPAVCEETDGDYTVRSDSPCLPDVSPCGELIGLLGVGCSPTLVESTSWGRIKIRFFR
jgi:predicted outer membrane repeat protein